MNDLNKHLTRKTLRDAQQMYEEELYSLAMTKGHLEDKLVEINGQALSLEKRISECERVLEELGYDH